MPRGPITDPDELPRPFPVVVALLRERTGIVMSTQRANFVCERALAQLRAAFADADAPGGAGLTTT